MRLRDALHVKACSTSHFPRKVCACSTETVWELHFNKACSKLIATVQITHNLNKPCVFVVFVSHGVLLSQCGRLLSYTHVWVHECTLTNSCTYASAYTYVHEVLTRGCFLLVLHTILFQCCKYLFGFFRGFSLQDWAPDYVILRNQS